VQKRGCATPRDRARAPPAAPAKRAARAFFAGGEKQKTAGGEKQKTTH
jgi:hypothetical protein